MRRYRDRRHLSGMVHLPGGERLEEAFHSLRMWIMSAACFSGWETTPHRQAGNDLLQLVRVQYQYVRNKVPRRDLMLELTKQGEGVVGPTNVVDKCAATIMQKMGKKKLQKSTPAWKRGHQGNGSAGTK
ncbi:hypothetical protein DIPPA_02468 [Diplonema papillatum]|nr:hypothetical protein DIPPA_02468 [Diplonema papillatum]